MERATLNVTPREGIGKGFNRRLRQQGITPAIVYGNNKQSLPISLNPKELVGILQGPTGRNTVIDLTVEGEGEPRMTVIKDYQVHPWKRKLRHVDFWEITPNTTLTLDIPLLTTGEAPSQKLGGRLSVKCMDLKVSCLPANIPASIVFDLATLGEEECSISISDLVLPEGVVAEGSEEMSVLSIRIPSAAELAAELAELEAEAGGGVSDEEAEGDEAEADSEEADEAKSEEE
jgi:large subunit ribosomal protein L25